MEHTTVTKKVIEFSDRVFILAALLVCGAIVLSIGIINFQLANPAGTHEFMVSGQGKAFGKPDIATVMLGMNTQGSNSQDVVNRNNTIINSVTQAMKDLGIDQKDIQTTSYSLSPQYDYTDKGRVFKGYSLDQQLTIKIRDFSKISSVLDKATSLGVNTIGDLQFTIDKPETVQAQARQDAIDQARQKAREMASQTGLHLGELISVSENNATPQPIFYDRAVSGSGGVPTVAPQIQTGQLEVDSTVTLTYRVR